jgi:transcriptional regulator with XRE-family HTH domain
MRDVTEEIRKEIRVELAKRGWTQQQLAEAADISEVHVSRLLSRSDDKRKRAGDLPESWQRIFDTLDLRVTVVPADENS